MGPVEFRRKHLLQLVENFDVQRGPLDKAIYYYYKNHHALGSQDRASITEDIYALFRLKLLLEHILLKKGAYLSWENLYDAFIKKEHIQAACDPTFLDHVRVSMPPVLFDQLVKSHGKRSAMQIAQSCNTQAPTTIRVNLLRISREELYQQFLQQGFSVRIDPVVPTAIHFDKKIAFFSLEQFQKGFFEVQDAASQLIAHALAAQPHESILDFCAGAGGKSLAFAPSLKGTGQIYLHDIRQEALLEAKKRLKRAGIQNAQIVHATETKRLQKLKKKMDWVYVDAPCSGTGTLRRNPDMKWRYSEQMLCELIGKQRLIFEQALSYMHPQGRIIYATCSILAEENEQQVAHFLKNYPIEQEGEYIKTIPKEGDADGFFAVTFRKKIL